MMTHGEHRLNQPAVRAALLSGGTRKSHTSPACTIRKRWERGTGVGVVPRLAEAR